MTTKNETSTAPEVTGSLPPALLAMEDGTIYRGFGFGSDAEGAGEIVFNTAITGYQEVITDPSYRGQLVTMTAPEIGNVGINPVDFESAKPWCAGFVVRDLSPAVSNWRASGGLHALLRDAGVAGITGIDTRAVTRRIRLSGAQRAIITRDVGNPKAAVEKARKHPSLEGRDLVKEVTTDKTYTWDETVWAGPRPGDPKGSPFADAPEKRHRVVAYDFGMKRGILRRLRSSGCDVTVVPAQTSAKDVLSLKPDGVFLSNGPGDPAAVEYAVEAARQICETKIPVFGICLGHQLLGLACGGKTYKLKFGHRGANHPVRNELTQKVEITSHNHGFAVDPDSLNANDVEITHWNLNDHTLEGFRHRRHPAFCVQYHPEAAPGPHDSHYLFDEFIKLMRESRPGAEK